MKRNLLNVRSTTFRIVVLGVACLAGPAAASVVVECWIAFSVRCASLHSWIDTGRKCTDGQGNVTLCGDRVVDSGFVSDIRLAMVGETGRLQIQNPFNSALVEVKTFKCVSGVCTPVLPNVIRSCQGRGAVGDECLGTAVAP